MSDQSVNLKNHMTTGHFSCFKRYSYFLAIRQHVTLCVIITLHLFTQYSAITVGLNTNTLSVHTNIPQSQLDLTQTAIDQHELSESNSNRQKLAQYAHQLTDNCIARESHDSNRSQSSSINWSQSLMLYGQPKGQNC